MATGGAMSNGGAATGGAATGGKTAGGAASIGGTATTGGKATGGAATGGAATGGAATGGANCSVTVSRVLVDNAVATLTANASSCAPDCALTVPCGSTVTLTPKPGASTGFAGWDDAGGACLGTTNPCVFQLTTNSTIKGTFSPYNRAFVTSSASSANLGGISGADATCRALATSAGLTSASSYVAFLSTDSTSAIDRLGTAQGWVRIDELPFADSIANIKVGTLWYPLVLTDAGTTAKLDGDIYTGSTATGASNSAYNCNGWTNATSSYNVQGGVIGGGSALWLTWGTGNCTQLPTAPFYCFGTAYKVPLAPPPSVTGRRIFVSSSNFAPATGKTIKDADNLCVSNATASGICSSSANCPFKAVLAQPGATAKSHFTNGDGTSPVVRLDNVKVASSSSLFWQGTLSAPISLNAADNYSTQGERLFTGAATPSTAGTTTSTCNNWSDATVTTGVNYGVPAMGASWFNWSTIWGCDSSNPIYCLEDIP